MTDVWVERYRKEVLPKLADTLRPSSVLVFGSRAVGAAHPESDLDVIIVAEAFAGIPFVRRMAHVLGLVRFPKHVDYAARFPQPPLKPDDLGLSLGCRLGGYVVWHPTQSRQPGNT